MNGKPTVKGNVKAIVWIAVIALIAGGYYLLKDRRVFVQRHDYYAYFADVQGLQPSSPVMIKGVRVGKISDIDINGRNVKITISVGKEVKIPDGTVAKLSSGGITGDKIIDLQLGKGPAILADYSTLQTGLDTSLLPVSVRFTPMIETAKFMLRSMDSTLQGVNSIFRTGMLSRTAHGVVNLEQKMHGLSNLSGRLNNEYNVQEIVESADVQARHLAARSGDLNRSVNDAVKSSSNMAKTNIVDDLDSVRLSIRSIGNSFHKLDTSMSGFGKLLKNRGTYESLSGSFDTLSRGWQQLQKAPPGISILGGKKKK